MHPSAFLHLPLWCFDRFVYVLTLPTDSSDRRFWISQLFYGINFSVVSTLLSASLKQISHRILPLPPEGCLIYTRVLYSPSTLPISYPLTEYTCIPRYIPPYDSKFFFGLYGTLSRLFMPMLFAILTDHMPGMLLNHPFFGVSQYCPMLRFPTFLSLDKLIGRAIRALAFSVSGCMPVFFSVCCCCTLRSNGGISRSCALFTRWKEELQQSLACVKLQKPHEEPRMFECYIKLATALQSVVGLLTPHTLPLTR